VLLKGGWVKIKILHNNLSAIPGILCDTS